MREQIEQWQQRLMQSAHVYFNNLKHNQAHWLRQLEALNPQRTLERGYAVILDKEKKAARNPRDLQVDEDYLVKLADGQITVSFKKLSP
jgi:exodeoxyribonuclease VII large subunit